MNDSPTVLVHAKGLQKDYGSGEGLVRALDAVDLDVSRGEAVAVMGRAAVANRRCSTCSAGSIVRAPVSCRSRGNASTGSPNAPSRTSAAMRSDSSSRPST